MTKHLVSVELLLVCLIGLSQANADQQAISSEQDDGLVWLESLTEPEENHHQIWVGQTQTDWPVGPINRSNYIGGQWQISPSWSLSVDLGGMDQVQTSDLYRSQQWNRYYASSLSYQQANWYSGFNVSINQFQEQYQEYWAQVLDDAQRLRNLYSVQSQVDSTEWALSLNGGMGWQWFDVLFQLGGQIQYSYSFSDYDLIERDQLQRLTPDRRQWSRLTEAQYLSDSDGTTHQWIGSLFLATQKSWEFELVELFVGTGFTLYHNLDYQEGTQTTTLERQLQSPEAQRLFNLQNRDQLTDGEKNRLNRIQQALQLTGGINRNAGVQTSGNLNFIPDEEFGGYGTLQTGITLFDNWTIQYSHTRNFAESTLYQSNSLELSYRF